MDTMGILVAALAVVLLAIDMLALACATPSGGGTAAFLIGSFVFFEGSDPLLHLLRGYIVEGVIVWAALFVLGVGQGLRAQRLSIKVGIETMLGKTVNALTPIGPTGGKVFVEGECWNATSDSAVEQGQPVEIIAVKGLTVRVKPNPMETSHGLRPRLRP